MVCLLIEIVIVKMLRGGRVYWLVTLFIAWCSRLLIQCLIYLWRWVCLRDINAIQHPKVSLVYIINSCLMRFNKLRLLRLLIFIILFYYSYYPYRLEYVPIGQVELRILDLIQVFIELIMGDHAIDNIVEFLYHSGWIIVYVEVFLLQG